MADRKQKVGLEAAIPPTLSRARRSASYPPGRGTAHTIQIAPPDQPRGRLIHQHPGSLMSKESARIGLSTTGGGGFTPDPWLRHRRFNSPAIHQHLRTTSIGKAFHP